MTCNPSDVLGTLTQKYLKEKLRYDSGTGIFCWKHNNDQAGWRNSKGYFYIKIDNRAYRRSRLAFLYMTGKWPAGQVDHIDGNKSDDSWSNIRSATARENANNQKRHRNGCLPGASYENTSWRVSKWRARAKVNGKEILIGYFPTEQEAHKAYTNFVEVLHPTAPTGASTHASVSQPAEGSEKE